MSNTPNNSKRDCDDERRTARRFQVSWPVTITGMDRLGGGFDESGKVECLSSLGAFMYLNTNISLGDRLELHIKAPLSRRNWMKYTAEVVRIEPASSRIGVALKFDTAVPAFIVR